MYSVETNLQFFSPSGSH